MVPANSRSPVHGIKEVRMTDRNDESADKSPSHLWDSHCVEIKQFIMAIAKLPKLRITLTNKSAAIVYPEIQVWSTDIHW
jgi:hypothetical protein